MGSQTRQSTASAKRAALSGRERARNRRIAFWLIVVLVVIAAFLGGFFVRSNVALMTSLGIPVDASEEAANTSSTTKAKTPFDSLSARISEVEDILSAYSFDDVSLTDATEMGLTELMASTDDAYAAYYNEDRYATYLKEDADRGFSGISVLFGEYDGRAYATDVLEGSEAQAKGVKQGDFVQAVDGDSSHAWSASEVIGALSKEDGDSVVITWMRPLSLDATTGDEFTTTLTCHTSETINVSSELNEDIGYIKLRQMTANSAELVQAAVEDLTAQGARAFVLDITDNPGGYLTQALDIASQFVSSGVLVGIQTPDGTTTRTATGATVTTAPLVVITNGYTSGVSEVLAAALKDNQRATIVGQTTTGKGSVQVTRELSFGGAIRYTAAYYLTPSGRDITANGVAPDVEVTNDASSDENTQLLVALATARSLIAS